MNKHVFLGDRLSALRASVASTHSRVYTRLVDQCETYFDEVLPEEHPPKSTTYMGIAMANLALAYLISQEQRYLHEAKRWVMKCVSYPHWGNAHLVDVDLSAAWILFGMGIAYDWIAADCSEAEQTAIRDKLLLQGRRMYDFKIDTEGSGWSTNYWQNHNWINLTGLATAGYALSATGEPVETWVSCAKENFAFVFSVLPKDGSDYEGVVYWRYGAMWLFVYAHLLKEREGIDHFKTCDFLKNTFTYRLYQAAPNLAEQINFGDTHDRHSGHSTAIYYKVAAEYRNGYAQKMGNLVRDELLEVEATRSAVKPGILPECFFEFLFYDPTVTERDFDDLPLTAFFDDLGLFVERSSWDRDATLVAFKCSRPGGKVQWDQLWRLKREKGYDCFGLSHQHPDNNSFLIHSQGRFFAIDDGYNREVRAADHNVILVDGVGYEGEGRNNIWKDYEPDMFGEIESYRNDDQLRHVVGETVRTYQKQLRMKTLRRHFVSTNAPWFVMLDEIDSEVPHTYTWQMYSDVQPLEYGEGFRYRIDAALLDLYVFSDVATATSHTEQVIRAVMTTQEPDKYTENRMQGLRIENTEPTRELSYLSVFVPKAGDDVRVSRIATEGAYGAEIVSGETREIVLFSHGRRGVFGDVDLDSVLTIIRYCQNSVESIVRA